jgi:hypothetical protein
MHDLDRVSFEIVIQSMRSRAGVQFWVQRTNSIRVRSLKPLKRLAPQAGLEPATLRLTAGFPPFWQEWLPDAACCRELLNPLGSQILQVADWLLLLPRVAGRHVLQTARKRHGHLDTVRR